ncbi:MAG: GerMN domain-containing protein [Bacteroidota bacterium]
MKSFSLFVFAGLLLLACNNKADQPVTEDDSTEMSTTIYSWQSALNDSTGRLEMKKVEAVGPDSLSPAAVIKYLNTTNSNVQLVFVKTSGDTAYLKIPDPMFLTQQIGSTGPTLYLSQVIYNLTEIPGINYVNLDFEEGDHASPGTYNRDSFKDE